MDSVLAEFIDNNANICKLDLRESESNRRIIAGYANISDLLDSQGDVVTHKALSEAWGKWRENPDFCVLSLLHSNVVVAKVIFEDVVDSKGNTHRSGMDDKGLYLVAEVRGDISIADDVWKKIERGELRGFSIGGRNLNPQPAKCDSQRCVRQIDSLELHEVAIVDQPANRVSIFNMLKRDDLAKLADATRDIPEQMVVEGAVKVSKKPCPETGLYHVLVKDGVTAPNLCPKKFAIVKETKEGEEYVDLFDLALLRPESVLTGEVQHSGCDSPPLKAEKPDEPTPQEGKVLSTDENKEVKTEKDKSKDESEKSEAPEETPPAVAPITLESIAADLARLNERLDTMEKRGVEKVEKSAQPAQPEKPAEVKPQEAPPPQAPPAQPPAEQKPPEVPVIQAAAAPPQEPPKPKAEPTPPPVVVPVESPKPAEPPKPVQPAQTETRGVNPQAVQPQRGDPLWEMYKMPWKEIHEAMASQKRM